MKKLIFIFILLLTIGCIETLNHSCPPTRTNTVLLTNNDSVVKIILSNNYPIQVELLTPLSVTNILPVKSHSLLDDQTRQQINDITTKPSFLAVKSLIYYLALFSACFALWWFILRKKLFSTNKPRNGGSK